MCTVINATVNYNVVTSDLLGNFVTHSLLHNITIEGYSK